PKVGTWSYRCLLSAEREPAIASPRATATRPSNASPGCSPRSSATIRLAPFATFRQLTRRRAVAGADGERSAAFRDILRAERSFAIGAPPTTTDGMLRQ